MYKDAIRPAWVEISLSNLDHNIKAIKKKIGAGKEIIGVIKADAYGHGAVMCSKVLRSNGVKTFAVATLQEAIVLRQSGADEKIIILGLTPDMYAEALIDYDLTPVICDIENAKAIDQAAKEHDTIVDALLVVDTGMGRIGYTIYEIEKAISDLQEMDTLEHVNIYGIFSHMATADALDKSFAKKQEEAFQRFYDKFQEAGYDFEFKTLANSASIMELPSIHYDAVRPGIILYGCYPSDEVDKNQIDLKPVMSVKANIVHLKEVPEGFSVGYGRKFIATRPSKIATIALGYADGYPRPFSENAQVLVGGKLCPIAGNICMDQCMIDVTDVEDVKAGDEVVIMGTQGDYTILADHIAKATGTINYEICCAFGQRLPKVYVK